MELKKYIKSTLRRYLNEVRYVNTNYPQIKDEEPLMDSQTIRVYHGFNKFDDVENVLKDGLSGKEKARRIYSYESGNNPYGLFVSVDFDVVKRNFAHGGVIIEFSTKVSDLEAPVWVGGRSYFVQGEYTQSFKDLDDREQQRLLNRQKSGESPYDYISKSDRPELGQTIFDNPEKQALYIGDLNPNMIKSVWYNEVLHKDRRINGPWVRMSRKEFIKKMEIKDEKNKFDRYYPNDDFNIDEFKVEYGEDYPSAIKAIIYDIDNDYTLKQYGFYPKQIKQLRDMYKSGEFDEYIK